MAKSKPKFSFMVGVGQNTDRPAPPLPPLKPDKPTANNDVTGKVTTQPFCPNQAGE
jgi:hypothetical protein